MRSISKFERALLTAILNRFPDELGDLAAEFEMLRVESVENSGAGAYVNFDSATQSLELPSETGQFGYDGEISVAGLHYGLGAVLDVSRRKLNHLELFTYGDETWDGNTMIEEFVIFK